MRPRRRRHDAESTEEVHTQTPQMIYSALLKPLWMVIYIHGQVAGVFLDEPMPDYMTFAECEASALMHTIGQPKSDGVVYKCEYAYGKPLNTGRYYRPLE